MIWNFFNRENIEGEKTKIKNHVTRTFKNAFSNIDSEMNSKLSKVKKSTKNKIQSDIKSTLSKRIKNLIARIETVQQEKKESKFNYNSSKRGYEQDIETLESIV